MEINDNNNKNIDAQTDKTETH